MANKGKRASGASPEPEASTREYKAFKFELESADENGEFSGYC